MTEQSSLIALRYEARGIGEALIATATGLCVAIFALVVHTYFAQRLDDILTAVERAEALVTAEVRKRGC